MRALRFLAGFSLAVTVLYFLLEGHESPYENREAETQAVPAFLHSQESQADREVVGSRDAVASRRTIAPARSEEQAARSERSLLYRDPEPPTIVMAAEPPPPDLGHEFPLSAEEYLERYAESWLTVHVTNAGNGQPVASSSVRLRPVWKDRHIMGEWIEARLAARPSFAEEYGLERLSMLILASWKTDANGEVVVPLVAGIRYALEVESPIEDAGDAHVSTPRLVHGKNHTLKVALPSGRDLNFALRVVDAHGFPVSGAEAELFESGEFVERMPIGGQGELEFSARSWRYSVLRMAAPGYAPTELELGRGHENWASAKTVSLQKWAAMEGQVLTQSGAPSPDTLVRASLARPQTLWDEMPPLFEGRQIKTDASGSFRLERLPPGLMLHILAIPAGATSPRLEVVLAPEQILVQNIRLGTCVRVHGRVVLPDSTTPVENIPVEMVRVRHDVPDVPHGEFFMLDEWMGLDKESVEVRTDQHGEFEFKNVSPGSWLVGLATYGTRLGHRFDDPNSIAPASVVIEVRGNEGELEIDLPVHRGLVIEGQVVDPHGKPPSQSSYVFAFDESLGGMAADCLEDGTFVIGPLLPGAYSVSTSGGWEWEEPFEFCAPPERRVEAGTRGIVIELLRTEKINGKVLDERGLPIKARIEVMSSTPPHPPPVESNEKGEFEIRGLAPGSYALRAESEHGLTAWQPTVATGPGHEPVVELRLSPASRLRLIRTEAESSSGENCRVELRVQGQLAFWKNWLSTDNELECLLPEGHYELTLREIRSNRWITNQTVQLTRDEVSTIEIRTE